MRITKLVKLTHNFTSNRIGAYYFNFILFCFTSKQILFRYMIAIKFKSKHDVNQHDAHLFTLSMKRLILTRFSRILAIYEGRIDKNCAKPTRFLDQFIKYVDPFFFRILPAFTIIMPLLKQRYGTDQLTVISSHWPNSRP